MIFTLSPWRLWARAAVLVLSLGILGFSLLWWAAEVQNSTPGVCSCR